MQASRVSIENSPLDQEISQELQTDEENAFFNRQSSNIVLVIAAFAGLSIFTLFCINSRRNHESYAQQDTDSVFCKIL
jgi:hypothetical protein